MLRYVSGFVRDPRFDGSVAAHRGAPVWIGYYGPFGQPLTSYGSVPLQGKACINERYDPETGLQYLHARYHDPLLGRFLTPDTLDPDMPGYAHTWNDRVNGAGPNGHNIRDSHDLASESRGLGGGGKNEWSSSAAGQGTNTDCRGCTKVAGDNVLPDWNAERELQRAMSNWQKGVPRPGDLQALQRAGIHIG